VVTAVFSVLFGSLLVANVTFSLPVGAAPSDFVELPELTRPLPSASDVFDLLAARLTTPAMPISRDWLRDRLGSLTPPIAGSSPTTYAGQLPGAPRAYRGGTHFGIDYYSGSSGVDVRIGTPVLAVDNGTVIRADAGYVELTAAQRDDVLQEARRVGDSDPRAIDPLHGMQVWILHPGGVISRYSHLSAIASGLGAGTPVVAGQVIGAVGNSGTTEGVRGSLLDAHLHLEIYVDFRLAWEGIPQSLIWPLLREILSSSR
jgi:murein DD-endopeptidase MepM/ murein hydrolase activator NlpD